MYKNRNILKNIFNYSLKRRNKKNFGFIEFISFGEISGWAYSKETKISFIGIFLGDELVTFTPLSLSREDIKEKFKINYSTGFRILFNYKMGRKINKGIPKIYALDSDKNILFELKILPKLKEKNLNRIFYSPYFGCDGRFDGINQEGTMSGWASKREYKGGLKIWLQSDKGIEAKEISCDIWRQDLFNFEVEDCGFEINPLEINNEYYHSNIWFSFDKEGKFNIDPTSKRVNFSFEGMQIIKQDDVTKFVNESDFLQEQRVLLNEFRLLLNKIENNK